MSDARPSPYTREFAGVLEAELDLIRARRREILREELARRERPIEPAEPDGTPKPAGDDADSRLTGARLEALDEHLTGLSFSGGGIRAGTFAVGVIQGLASLGLLRRFDYLSTVSGGGYAGGWLAAWLKRDGSVANVESQLAPSRVQQGGAWRALLNPPPSAEYPPAEGPETKPPVVDEEPEPIRHLRSYSSYMAPRLGILTADTGTIVMIWARNVSVNLMMFLPAAMLVVLLARLLINLYGTMTSDAIGRSPSLQDFGFVSLGLGVFLLAVASVYNGRALSEFRREGAPRPWRDEAGGIYRWMVYPAVGSALALTLGLRPVLWWVGSGIESGVRRTSAARVPSPPLSPGGVRDWVVNQFGRDLGLLGIPNVLGHALVLGLAFAVGAGLVNLGNRRLRDGRRGRYGPKFLSCAFIAGATGGVLLTLVEHVLTRLSDAQRPELVAMLGVPAIFLVIAAALIVEVALLGRSIAEAEREWWSRVGALALIGGILWAATFAVILYVPAIFLGFGLPVRLAISSGWLGTVVAGVLAGRKGRPAGQGGSGVLETIATVAPPIFLVGFLGAVALLAASLVNDPGVAFPPAGGEALGVSNYLKGVRGASLPRIVLWLATFGVLGRIGSSLIDVNLFSINAMYANRLVRGYLAASRRKPRWAGRWGVNGHDPRVSSGAPIQTAPDPRDENPVTGFDPGDDLALLDLRIGYVRPGDLGGRPFWGPQLLVNASLNLVGDAELALRDRKGESFTLSPLYCGSKGTGYALVDEPTRERLTLGRAMSISGAAVDPNMRTYQSASLTAFLTLVNARLGYWIRNPDRAGWAAQSPRLANLLLTEFLGRTDGKGDYVHLSDGGHFENMGVYELIRRRCRYIVACDAGEDTGPSDDNLGILVRLARIDFGVRIEVNAEPFRVAGPDDLARAHVIVGRIHYEDVNSGQLPGILVYVRISMTGDEPPDVQQYARNAPGFPHQPTDLRQSFTEDQFESYRALGDHIARSVFRDAANRLRDRLWTEADPRREFVRGNRLLFSALQGRWADTPVNQAARSIHSSEAWIALRRDLRDGPALGGLVADAFPELHAVGPADPPDRAAMQAVGQVLQLMEDAWLELGLAGRSSLPTNRGWMNAFRRWVGTEAFRRYWPVFRSSISPDFARFLQDELHLAPPTPARLPLDRVRPESLRDESVATLTAEFAREWPLGDARGRDLASLIEQAGKPEGRAWLLFVSPSGREAGAGGELPSGSFIVGLALLMAEEGRDLEFLAWIRPPHRASGLGTGLIGPLIEGLRDELRGELPAGGSRTVRTHYPKSGREGDDDAERDRWLNFFTLYDFHPENPLTRPGRKDSTAVLKVQAPAPAGATMTALPDPATTPAEARPIRRSPLRRFAIALGIVGLLVGATYLVTDVFHVGGVDLPMDQSVPEGRVEHPDQNWKDGWGLDGKQWFHHANQGTRILPYEWFMALERPEISPFRARSRIAEGDYLRRFGFIPSEPDPALNPDGLPIGFATQADFRDPTAPEKGAFRVVGLTCAACHTAEIHYRAEGGDFRAIRIEGGPAMINLALFQKAIGLALFYTNFFEARFNRFADRVLGDARKDLPDERRKLRDELGRFVETSLSAQSYAEKKGLNALDLGFARTDALGLIGNRVFGPLGQENLSVADAPVNFPHLWDTSWLDWIQYNASIRMPMVRNIGEALGVGGVVKLDVAKGDRFPSSVNVENLHRLEALLGGKAPYGGLRSPKWSDTGLPRIDALKRDRGEALYRKLCQSCHLPPPAELEADAVAGKPRHWYDEGPEGGPKIRVLRVHVSDLQVIGTDPNEALNFYRRLAFVGDRTVSASKGLYNVTGFIRNKFFASQGLLDIGEGPDRAARLARRLDYDRNRPFDDPSIDRGEYDLSDEALISRVIVPRLAYKARPLNGIWATAPFLHNGSVPNLYQVLLPAGRRDPTFYLGSKVFDPEAVGFVTDSLAGGFKLDTSLSGNTNVGHEFRNLDLDEAERAMGVNPPRTGVLLPDDDRWAHLAGLTPAGWRDLGPDRQRAMIRGWTQGWVGERGSRPVPKGVIGPELTDTERWELVEYLKSI